jgi:hypothetical protein
MMRKISVRGLVAALVSVHFAFGAAAAHAGSGEWTFLGGAAEENSRGFTVAGKPTTIYILTQAYSVNGKSFISRSSDLGDTWQTFPLPANGLDGKGAYLIAGDGANPTLYYVNVNPIDNMPFKYRSDDGGETWASTQETIQLPTDSGLLAIDPANSNLEWKLDTSSSGLMLPYMSSDGGKTWTLITKGGHFAIHNAEGETARLMFDPNNDKRIFLYHDVRDAAGYPSEVWEYTISDSTTPPQQVVKGDMNGDGKITIADATLVLRVAVGLVPPSSLMMKAVPAKKDAASPKNQKVSARMRG